MFNLHKNVISLILKNILPMFPAMIFFGIIFGFTGNLAGFTLGVVSSMSYVIFAGSAQFIVLLLLIDNEPAAAILVTALLINSRHLIYGIAMNAKLKAKGILKLFQAYFLIDEAFLAFNLTIPMIEKSEEIETETVDLDRVFLLIGIPMWLIWNTCTIIGYLLFNSIGDKIDIPENFIIASTFLGFAVDQWRNNTEQRWLIAISIGLCFVFGFILDNSILFVVVMGVGIVLTMWRSSRRISNGS